MTRQQMLLLALIASLAIAGVMWFFNNFERVPHKEWIGFQGEARRHPYLAAERLLVRMGASSRHAQTPTELRDLPPDGTLILPDSRAAITADARARLLEWVEVGGHLIVEDEDRRLPDPILDALGVARAATEKSEQQPRTLEVRLPHAPRPMKVEMHAQQTIDAPQATVRVTGRIATHLLHFPRGRGQVTVLNDLAFMRNAGIGAHDHAEFLWQLIRFQPQTAAVVFFDNTQRISLWGWLMANAWAVLAGGAALLVLWLWHIVPRFGPLAPDPEPARRRLLDHLRASGRFQWSAGGAARLAESAREAAFRRIARAHPDFVGLSRAEREQRLAAVFGLDTAAAKVVLEREESIPPHEFMYTMRVFQRIHERLARREKK